MVLLKNDIYIETSPNNYTLMLDKHKADKKGKPVYEVLGYYMSFAGAVYGAREYCIKKRLAESEYTLREAIEEIQKITDEFASLLKREMEKDNG